MAITTFTEEYPHSAPMPRADEPLGDGELLEQFIRTQDADAFEELVRRHGPMVLGVCRRVLDNAHDAEDCFQAVFLVLVRKATSIQPRDMVGNWLYGVAYRTALEAKKLAARRRAREKKRCEMPRPEPDDGRWQDLKPLLDQELTNLPDKYRFVLVASDLEGRTRKEIAHSLGLPEGTIASRLARARVMLAKRLARRNFAISAGALALLLSEQAAADVPPFLTTTTARAATQLAAGKPMTAIATDPVAALADAVVRSFWWTKLTVAGSVLVMLAMLGMSIGSFLPSVLAERKHDGAAVKPEHLHDCIVEKVDRARRTIQASSSTDIGVEVHDIEVQPATRIYVDGREAELADLRAGMIVHIETQKGPDSTRKTLLVKVVGKAVVGIVDAMNGDSLTISCSEKMVTYKVDKKAKIYVDGKICKPGDLKPKMPVTLKVAPDKRKALGVKAQGPKVAGTIKQVFIDKRTLALDKEAQDIPVPADAIVVVNGKNVEFADLTPGMRVTVQMSALPEQRQAVAVAALGR